MWFFAGLLIGGIIGSNGGIESTFLCAIFGGIAGAILGSALKRTLGGGRDADKFADIDFKLEHIYKSLGDIHERLLRLEQPRTQDAQPSVAASAAPVPTSTDHAPTSRVRKAAEA